MPSHPKIEIVQDEKALIARLAGPLEGYGSGWQDEINAQAEQTKKDVIVNLSRATFLDSRGMGYLFGLHKRLNASGRQLLLVVTSSAVRDALEAAGVVILMRVYDSETVAKEAL